MKNVCTIAVESKIDFGHEEVEYRNDCKLLPIVSEIYRFTIYIVVNNQKFVHYFADCEDFDYDCEELLKCYNNAYKGALKEVKKITKMIEDET